MAREKKILPVRMAVLFFLSVLCICIITHPAAADGEEERFTISCDTGDDVYITDTASEYPVWVTVRNNGRDFNGVIKIMMYTGSNMKETIAYAQPAAILSGEMQKFSFNMQSIYFDMASYEVPIRVDCLDENGNQVFSQAASVPIVSEGTSTICAGVVSHNSQISQMMNSSGFEYENAYVWGRVTMHGEDMNAGDILAADLSGMNMMVLDMYVPDEALVKIKDWLMEGGHLMISQALYEQYFGKPLSEDGMAAWGNGRILVYSEDKWSGSMLIQSVKSLFGSSGMYELLGGSSDPYWVAATVLGYDMWSKVPGIGKYLAVLLIYILLIGPAAYILLFKRKDRIEYLWGAIPCLAVVFSVLVWYLGGDTRYEDTFVHFNSMVHLTDEGTIEDTCIKVVSPDKGHTVLTLSEQCQLVPLSDDSYWNDGGDLRQGQERLMREDYDLAITALDEKTELFINSKAVFDQDYFWVSRVRENDGELNASLKYYKGCFNGIITNSTPWDLKNAFIYYNGIGLVLGALPAGQSISLENAEADTVIIAADSLMFDSSEYGMDHNQMAAERIMEEMIYYSGVLQEKKGMFIGGFTEEYDIGIDQGDQIESVNGIALIMQDISVTDSGNGWFSQAIVRGEGIEDTDRQNYDLDSYIIYGTEVIQLNYQLNGNCQPDYMKWLNADPSVHIEFYNRKSDEFEPVMTDAYVMNGEELAPYLDEMYQIRAKVQVDDTGVLSYIPAFTVTGGEVYD